MHTLKLLLCAGFTLLATTHIAARSSGAPGEACSTMVPRHGAEGKSGRGRYGLTQNYLDFTEHDLIQVNLTATGRATFKGFLIKALVKGKEKGAFLRGKDVQPMRACPGFATHVDSRRKTHVVLLWSPPRDTGMVHFVATVVKDYTTFYTNITSVLKE